MREQLRWWRGFFLIAVLAISGCDSDKDIVSGLSELEANEILVVLGTQKIPAQKVMVPGRVVTFTVTVRGARFADALKILVDNRLPREKSSGLAQVYPPGSQGLIPTKSEERARYMMALQGEIENMIKILPGIVSAKVAVVLPDTEAIRDVGAPPPRATASLAVVYNPVPTGQRVNADDIKSLVASAVEDLSPQDVTVVLAPNLPFNLANAANKDVGIDSSPSATHKALKEPPKLPGGPQSAEPLQTPPQAAAVSALPGVSVTKPAAAPTNVGHATQAQQHDTRTSKMLVLFAMLALLGLLVGIIGVLRAISLKSKMAKLQLEAKPDSAKAISKPKTEQPKAIAGPAEPESV